MVLNLGESKVPVSLETFRQAWILYEAILEIQGFTFLLGKVPHFSHYENVSHHRNGSEDNGEYSTRQRSETFDTLNRNNKII